ncbi:MAG TPA: hypothetical protein VJR05_13425 [Acidimicrobiia bacterium]|nr:hypothetical protein [Acidimicrobiia bacterium]
MKNTTASRLAWTTWLGLLLTVTVGLVAWLINLNRGGSSLLVSGVVAEGSAGALVVISYCLGAVLVGAVGALITSRVAGNRIGWILLVLAIWTGVSFAAGSVLHALATADPTRTALGDFANWIGNWSFIPEYTVPLTFVLLLVPDGRLPNKRWWPVPWLAGVGIGGWLVSAAFFEYLGISPRSLPNPIYDPAVVAVADPLTFALLPGFVGSVLALVYRYRRAIPLVRQQLKWVALGGSVEVSVALGIWGTSLFRPAAFGLTAIAVGALAGLVTPTAIGVAILRYRLYDIDRLINRTVAYGLVVGFLIAVYSVVTIGVPRLFVITGDSPVLVAGATLTVFALFRPVTRRVQSAVERRFNRARYDARREVDELSSQLAHGADLSQVVVATTRLLQRTLQPERMGVWIGERKPST